MDRPRGDSMPGTVVSASYAFREVSNPADDMDGGIAIGRREGSRGKRASEAEDTEKRGSCYRGRSGRSMASSRRFDSTIEVAATYP